MELGDLRRLGIGLLRSRLQPASSSPLFNAGQVVKRSSDPTTSTTTTTTQPSSTPSTSPQLTPVHRSYPPLPTPNGLTSLASANLFDQLLLNLVQLLLGDAALFEARVLALQSNLRGLFAFVEHGVGRLNVVGGKAEILER